MNKVIVVCVFFFVGVVACSKIPVVRRVVFNSTGGNLVEDQLINEGSKAIVPLPPTKENNVFVGWYSSAKLTEEFNFDVPIIKDTVVYAKWALNVKQGTTLINGHTYKTVTIGNQTWLAQNLNEDLHELGVSEYYFYINEGTLTRFGRLYDWDAAMDVDSKIAGWHLPSAAEWDILVKFLGGDMLAGEKLKLNGEASFEALYSGLQNDVGNANSLGEYCFFWTSTKFDNKSAWNRNIWGKGSGVFRNYNNFKNRLSVRLVKD